MLHTLSRSLRENKGPALVTVLLSALEVVFEIVIPLYMSNLIDFGIEGGSMAAVWKFGAFLLLLAAFQLATGVLAARIAARASVGFGANLREDMYNNVQTLRIFQHRQVFHRIHRHAPDDGRHERAECLSDAHAHGDPLAGHADFFHDRVVPHQP